MRKRSSRCAWLALMVAAVSTMPPVTVPAGAAEQPATFNGTWDLTWQTDKGPVRKGDMEIVQSGTDLALTIHGNSTIKASGRAEGHSFFVRGSRFLISYLITRNVTGNSMAGSLKVMSTERLFTAERRAR